MVNEFAIIVACTSQGGIGYNNNIPWHIPADLKHFKDITTSVPYDGVVNAVIMGKNTWMSLPKQHKPLKSRLNIVVSSTLSEDDMCGYEDAINVTSLQNAIEHLLTNKRVYNVFVIGGARLYNEALLNPLFKKAYVTQVKVKDEAQIDCDTFIDLSTLELNFTCQRQGTLIRHNHMLYRFCEFLRHQH